MGAKTSSLVGNTAFFPSYTTLPVADSRLIEALDNVNLPAIEELLCSGVTGNAQSNNSGSLLRRSVAQQHCAAGCLLLKHGGADPNVVSVLGTTPLQDMSQHSVITDEAATFAVCLMDHGAKVDLPGGYGSESSLLRWAVTCNNEVLLTRMLKEPSVDMNAVESMGGPLSRNPEMLSMVLFAAKRKYAHSLRVLLEHGAKVSFETKAERTVLFELIQENNHHALSLLFTYFPPPPQKDYFKKWLRDTYARPVLSLVRKTPVPMAHVYSVLLSPTWRPYFDIEEEYQESLYVRTPLYHAASQNDLVGVELLIRAGANVNHPRNCPLFIAAQKGHYDVVKALLDGGAKVNCDQEGSAKVIVDNRGFTPLYGACTRGHVEVTKLLLRAGADLQITPKFFAGYEKVAENRKLYGLIQAIEEIQNERSLGLLAKVLAKARNEGRYETALERWSHDEIFDPNVLRILLECVSTVKFSRAQRQMQTDSSSSSRSTTTPPISRSPQLRSSSAIAATAGPVQPAAYLDVPQFDMPDVAPFRVLNRDDLRETQQPPPPPPAPPLHPALARTRVPYRAPAMPAPTYTPEEERELNELLGR